MRWKSALIAIAAVAAAGSGGAVQAAPATSDQAQSIKTALERYLGRGADGNAVKVTPNGDAYTIDVDIKQTLHVLEPLGVVFEPVTYSMTVVPRDDGTWHVTSGSLPTLTAKFREQTTSIAANGMRFDGIYDPRIPAFTHYTSSYDSLNVGTVGKTVAIQIRQLNDGKQTFTGTPGSEGVVTATMAQTNSSYSQEAVFDNAPKPGQPAGLDKLSIKSGATREGLTIDDLHIRALADLWAFFVAHPSPDALKTNQNDLRNLLRQALPLFKHFAQSANLDQMSVSTPLGPVTAKGFTAAIDLDGLTEDGRAGLGLKIDGLSTPTGFLPPWSFDLIPTALDLNVGSAGYRLDTAAKAVVDTFDLNAPQPFPPEFADTLKTMMGPLDKMMVTIAPSRIASKVLDIRVDGQVRFTQPMPTFTVTAHATGVDKAIQSIQLQAGRDPNAAQLIAGMMLAKGYGKAETDGSLTWVIAGGGAAEAVTVNGVALPMGAGK